MRAAGGRAGKHEPVDSRPVVEGEHLGDHPAQARPDDVCPLDAGLVQHLSDVAGHRLDRIRAGRRIALADARLSKSRTSKRSASRSATGSQPQRA